METKELAEELKKTGAQVDDVPTYETGYVSCPLINEKREFEEGTIDLAVFTSASTVKGFVESTKGLDYSRFVLHVLENRLVQRRILMECRHICQKKQPSTV